MATTLSKKANKAKRSKERDADTQAQIDAYVAGYQQGFSAGWSEAVTKGLASVVDLYGVQLAQDDLPYWQTDWSFVGADMQNALDSICSRPDVASVLALHEYKPMAERLTTTLESDDDEPAVDETT